MARSNKVIPGGSLEVKSDHILSIFPAEAMYFSAFRFRQVPSPDTLVLKKMLYV